MLEKLRCKYMNHLTSTSGKGIAKVIGDFLSGENIDTSEFVEIGCDETACNSVRKNVATAQLEIYLNKPLQIIVFLPPTNKLPLRQIIEEIEGKDTGLVR